MEKLDNNIRERLEATVTQKSMSEAQTYVDKTVRSYLKPASPQGSSDSTATPSPSASPKPTSTPSSKTPAQPAQSDQAKQEG